LAEIDDITKEALRRANQMHFRSQNPAKKPPAQPEKREPEVKSQNRTSGNILSNLFGNNDNSIILILLILLMGEDTDPSLLLALIYLLL
jgi:hypothetical protein